jgi:hypothetical protein
LGLWRHEWRLYFALRDAVPVSTPEEFVRLYVRYLRTHVWVHDQNASHEVFADRGHIFGQLQTPLHDVLDYLLRTEGLARIHVLIRFLLLPTEGSEAADHIAKQDAKAPDISLFRIVASPLSREHDFWRRVPRSAAVGKHSLTGPLQLLAEAEIDEPCVPS